MIRLRTFFFFIFFLKIMSSLQAKASAKAKSPFKTRYEAIGYMFGKPLESFNHLLPVKIPVDPSQPQSPRPSSSKSPPDKPSSLMEVALDMDKILPTDLDVICNWIFECDRTRTSRAFPEANSVIHQVTDNLIQFWKDNSSIELR